MVVKNISIMEDVYRLLLARKMTSESFSDVIRRELNVKRDIMELAGVWKTMDKRETDRMKEGIEKHDIKETKKLLEKYQK